MKTKAFLVLAGFLLLLARDGHWATAVEGKNSDRPAEIEKALKRAGSNRPEMEKALQRTPADQRAGIIFLIANMPDRDLRSLRADFLRENVALAYQVRKQAAWGKKIPEEIFLNDVLPYANVDETREAWRKKLYELCGPIVKDCKTPAEAAQRLNGTIFAKLKVRYSTQRKKACQSPKESMETGLASCTGLSILLIDACRSVGVPARLVGTPLWANQRGNHTWVEIWDGGWHFTGAAEPDPKGLDRAWFVGDASQAIASSRVHAIYAASFRKTEVAFPLVWAPDRKDISAENVTARYARVQSINIKRVRVLIRVYEVGRRQRLPEPVTVLDRLDPNQVFQGESRGEQADANDILTFEVPAGRDYLVRVGKPTRLEKSFQTTSAPEQLVEVEVPKPRTAKPVKKSRLSKQQRSQITQAGRDFFAAGEGERARYPDDAALDQLLAGHEQEVRRLVWKAYQAAPIHAEARKDFRKHQVRFEKHLSPYTVKKVGQRPKNGWPLFIAMHGGGNAPQELNDSQWRIMQIYYRDQVGVTGYQYLALRAPNNTWNGFYTDYVPPLIINLIRRFVLLGDVDPDKVFLMGYSHGGYGAFYIGPKIPDRFAAVHCSAAAPTDGSISPITLRNTRFTFMIGANDTAYGRRQRCEAFNQAVQQLCKENSDAYPVQMELKEGFGHGGLPDRDKIKEMYPFRRNPVPPHLTWELTDSFITHFFWLSVPKPASQQSIDAVVRDNTVRITTRKVSQLALDLHGRLVDYARPLTVVLNDKTQVVMLHPRFLTLCASLLERGDPQLAYTCRIALKVK